MKLAGNPHIYKGLKLLIMIMYVEMGERSVINQTAVNVIKLNSIRLVRNLICFFFLGMNNVIIGDCHKINVQAINFFHTFA